ncbi:pyridoxal phosphate-dependent aminotransferase [Streptomyces sp. NPDC059651]|uniref:pyridoxal phosphate-dependent aminotransferase n=1 Tax=Streptomyces sp. NPDC059651 TaxID=3346897 RepID=UPI0036B602AA
MVAAHASADQLTLLDWNESPIGPPELAVERVMEAARRIHRYPRGLMEEVTDLAAAHFGVAPQEVLLTAGVDEAVDIALSLAERGWGVSPGFDGYEDRVRANGKIFQPIPLGPDWQPAGPPEPSLGQGDLVFLAQPGNPTGNLFPTSWVSEVGAAAEHLLIDETYQEFSSRPSVLGDGLAPGLLVYRSFSKAAGLAGIRLGCLIADRATIARLAPFRRFMPIDAVSLSAVAGLLEEPTFLDRLATYVRRARSELVEGLHGTGLFTEVRDTEANFVLASPRAEVASALAGQLARDQVLVKDCSVLGLPGWLRISTGSQEDQARLLTSLRSLTAASLTAIPQSGNRPAAMSQEGLLS